MGGTGGGIAYTREEFNQLIALGLDLSPVGEVLIEESVIGWKEFELEVMRDRADNVLDSGCDRREIVAAVGRQLAHGRYPSSHLYGDGGAGARIAKVLVNAPLRVQKRLFY